MNKLIIDNTLDHFDVSVEESQPVSLLRFNKSIMGKFDNISSFCSSLRGASSGTNQNTKTRKQLSQKKMFKYTAVAVIAKSKDFQLIT